MNERIPTLDEIGIKIFITDQSHECQQRNDGSTPGYVVSVYKWKKKKTLLASMWNSSQSQAEKIAEEYAREYLTMYVCGWK